MTDILNLIPDPQFTTHSWRARNVTATLVSGQQAMALTSGGGLEAYVDLAVDVSAYRGASMTFACTLSQIHGNAAECHNGLLFAWTDGPHNVGDGGTAKVGRKVLQFTLPGDVHSITLRLYAPTTSGSAFQWWHPILTRTEDYQRLLNGTATGAAIDYFDGDTNPE